MKLGSCCSRANSPDEPTNSIYFTQTTTPIPIPFGAGTETTVLNLPVQITANLQPVLLNGLVQIQSVIPTGLTLNYQYGVILRIRRNGNLLFTQSLQEGNLANASVSFTQVRTIPISIVDNNTFIGTTTYTVSLEYSVRSAVGITITAQSRSLNGLTV